MKTARSNNDMVLGVATIATFLGWPAVIICGLMYRFDIYDTYGLSMFLIVISTFATLVLYVSADTQSCVRKNTALAKKIEHEIEQQVVMDIDALSNTMSDQKSFLVLIDIVMHWQGEEGRLLLCEAVKCLDYIENPAARKIEQLQAYIKNFKIKNLLVDEAETDSQIKKTAEELREILQETAEAFKFKE